MLIATFVVALAYLIGVSIAAMLIASSRYMDLKYREACEGIDDPNIYWLWPTLLFKLLKLYLSDINK